MSETAPFWAIASLVSGSVAPEDFQVSLEDIVSYTGRLVEGELASYSAKGTPFQEGDVLFGKLRPYLAKYWLADRKGTAGGDIHVYRPASNTDSRYLSFLVGTEEFIGFADASSKGTKMPRVEWPSIRQFQAPRFDLKTQQRIADYLDRETGRIDAMIGKLDRLAETLAERRNDAVATALASDSEVSIGLLADVKLGKMLQSSQKSPTDQKKPYLRAAHVQPGGQLDFSVTRQEMWFSANEAQELDLRSGDAVVVEGGAGFGRSAYLDQDLPGWGFQNSIIRLRSNPDDGRYITYALSAALHSGAVAVACNSTTFAHFTAEKVEAFRIPFHSKDERRRIADYLDETTAKIDAMLDKVAQLKDLLTERRAALITAVVTGRKDIA